MRTNTARDFSDVRTHEGAQAFPHLKPIDQLRRSVLACMLWEKGFYESGTDIAERIERLSQQVAADDLAALAVEARTEHNLRHAPLMLLIGLIRQGAKCSDTIADTINRPDEMGELLSLYWRDGKVPLSKQLRKGLAKAFCKFDRYQLAKWNRGDAIKLRDVMFLCHPKPKDKGQADTFKALADGNLSAPDTWEVSLSAGKGKKETFTRLLSENKLGYMALLRNLRNMDQAGVDSALVESAIIARKGAHRVLPFRYVAAARACPRFEPALDKALCAAIAEQPELDGQTVVLVDVSGSMSWGNVSARSDITSMDAAATLASMINGKLRVFTFSHMVVEVAPRRGMSGVDAVINSQPNVGTYLGKAVQHMNGIPHDRLIVITDEQSHDVVPNPVCERAYMINVASNRNGVGYGKWTHLDGFSESVLKWIHAHESSGIA